MSSTHAAISMPITLRPTAVAPQLSRIVQRNVASLRMTARPPRRLASIDSPPASGSAAPALVRSAKAAAMVTTWPLVAIR